MNSTNSPVRFFTTNDADTSALEGERVAVLGYGHLGRPLALNLRDSGIPLSIGNIADACAEQARADGFDVLSPSDAAAGADLVLLLLPDEVIPEVFAADVAPRLSPGSAIILASGYALAYGLIQPDPNTDVLLCAPRMAGENARQRFLRGQGCFAYLSVEQDATGKAWRRLLGLAAAAGVLEAGALQLSARQEADVDLFVEQSLGAAIGAAVLAAFAVGREAGIPAEILVMEMYMSGEMETVFGAFREQGFFESAEAHGPAAMFGAYRRTMELSQALTTRFTETLKHLQSGEFAGQFQAERDAGYPTLAMAKAMIAGDNEIAGAESRLRALLPGASPHR
jgi:ketol-acid reductoisomerase